MACKIVYGIDGQANMMVCTRNSKPRNCHYCGKPAASLCDYPVDGGTCSRPLCYDCRVHVGWRKDYCREHVEDRHEE